MANFNDRGGNNRFGGGSRPGFKKSWGDGRSNDRPVVFHKAVCAECGKPCEVPFRPMQGKPVYCKDCFEKRGGNTGQDREGQRGDRFPKRDFNSRGSERPVYQNNLSSDSATKLLEAMNSKLERLIRAVEGLEPRAKVETKTTVKETPVVQAEKRPKKKAAKK